MKKRIIYCLAVMMYQFDLRTFLMGGGERWFYDFTRLLKNAGYDIKIYQFSLEEKTVYYKDMEINGLGNIRYGNSPQINYKNGFDKFNRIAISKHANGLFYLSMDLCMESPKLPTLTVSHGLAFDGILPGEMTFNYYGNLKKYREWIRCCTKAISVDTNSIKVMQLSEQNLANRMVYIPNYVDTEQFRSSDTWGNTDKFRVLYPRRLQWSRGITYMMEAVDILLKKYDDMQFTFCGIGCNKKEDDFFAEWYNRHDKEKVKHIHVDMTEMPNVYRDAEINIIPSTMAEGTSLSCLEGLSSGLPEIVTWIGGLTDLILQGYNGILIPPRNAESIADAIEYMYNNRPRLQQMRENAIKTSRMFSKKRWEKDILRIVREVFM